jgi:H+/Cl- antiporter ClcA
MSFTQIVCYIAIALLIGVVGYILFQYLSSCFISYHMNSKLVGDGNSKAMVKIQDTVLLSLPPEDEESGYTSD